MLSRRRQRTVPYLIPLFTVSVKMSKYYPVQRPVKPVFNSVHIKYNIFLDRIMCEALTDHEGSVGIGGQLITNFRFADDIVVNAEEEEEAGILVNRLDTTTTRYKMETGPDKTKMMTNNPKWLPKREQDKRSETRSS